jgi:hypothetical protein
VVKIAGSIVLFAAAMLAACGNDELPKIDASTIDAPMSCAGTLGALETCTGNEACTSCLCNLFGHQMLCTKTCMGPADCPAPFMGGCINGTCRP